MSKYQPAPSLDELPLFEQHRARVSDPPTAHQAAARRNTRPREHWDDIIADLRLHGASTYREVATRIGVPGTTVSTILTKMERAGVLRRTGDRRDGAMLRELLS